MVTKFILQPNQRTLKNFKLAKLLNLFNINYTYDNNSKIYGGIVV